MSNYELLEIISKQKSWGRNEIRNINTLNDYELDELSSLLDKPVSPDTEVIYQIITNYDGDVYNIKDLYMEYLSLNKNISKDLALILFNNCNVNGDIFNDFNNRLRFSNSKRHLCRKLVYSYLNVRYGIDCK